MINILKVSFVAVILTFLFNRSKNEDVVEIIKPETTNDNLFVNGVVFPVGNETTNVTMYRVSPSETFKTRSFTIVKKTTTSQQDSETVSVVINYPSNQLSVNGTYTVSTVANTQNSNIAVCSYSNFNNDFDGPQPTASPATVKVTDNGNNNYKLEFNNVIVKSGNLTKIITGYTQANFRQI